LLSISTVWSAAEAEIEKKIEEIKNIEVAITLYKKLILLRLV
jgi:hypothetical protein|tara:strand:+ start:366 stop:491 length:126 start_codon:yes stop_codon:yes gene_type:complete